MIDSPSDDLFEAGPVPSKTTDLSLQTSTRQNRAMSTTASPRNPPPPPALGSLRIAGVQDILRLGIVCTAGFRYAEQFIYERPYHEEHPFSTITFFRHEVKEFIDSPEHIVLVAVDKYEPDESSKTEAIIPEQNGWVPPVPGDEIVVGLAIWKLEPGSHRAGAFPGPPGNAPELPPYDGADMDQARAKQVAEVAEAGEHKYIADISTMERTVVHPAYWKRGHGSRLTQWGVDLATLDTVDQGVLASGMGARLFEHVGFKRIIDLHVPGDKKDPEGFDLAVLRYHGSSSGSGSSRGRSGCVIL